MLNLKHIAIATGGTLVTASISKLSRSQFHTTIRTLKRLGYTFPNDDLTYRSPSATGSEFSFEFASDDNSYKLVVSVGGDDSRTTLTVSDTNTRPHRHERLMYKPTSDLDTSVAKRVGDLLDALNSKES